MKQMHLIAILALLSLSVLIATSMITCKANSKDRMYKPSWSMLEGQRLSSVAWSPDGKHIAFVATIKPKTGDEEMSGVAKADIWVLSMPTENNQSSLRRLVEITRKNEGIPVALFWLSNDQIGWAAEEGKYYGAGCAFFTIKLKDSTINHLIDLRFEIGQSRAYQETNAPDDVWFDRKSNSLIFSGITDAVANASKNVVYVYNLSNKILSVVPLSVEVVDYVTITGAIKEYQKSGDFYVAAHLDNNWVLWHDGLLFLDRNHIILSLKDRLVFFPRVSPMHRMLAWMQSSPKDREVIEIVVSDLDGKTQNVIARLPYSWVISMNPALGCPYSWSPKGDQIAYADGSTIKFVKVPAQK